MEGRLSYLIGGWGKLYWEGHIGTKTWMISEDIRKLNSAFSWIEINKEMKIYYSLSLPVGHCDI